MESTSNVVIIIAGIVAIIGGIGGIVTVIQRWVARRKSHYDNPADAFYFGRGDRGSSRDSRSRVLTWMRKPATGTEYVLGFGILMALLGFCGGFMIGAEAMKCLH